MKGYDLYRYLKPIWNTDIIENETFMFLGEDDEAPFLYEPAEILAVKNYRLDKEFACGTDYDIVNGKIRRAGSAIPFYKIEDYFTDDRGIFSIGVAPATVQKYGLKGEKYLLYGEGDTFTKNQIAVTYKTKEKWGGPIPLDKQEKFPVFTNKISTGERLKITFYGDSIMTGCNASGTPMGGNIPPYMDAFPVLIKEFLQGAFHADVEMSNVGGTLTKVSPHLTSAFCLPCRTCSSSASA